MRTRARASAAEVLDLDVTVTSTPGSPFTEFYRRQYASTVRLAYLLTGSAEAQDLAQEAFIRLHRNWDRVEQPTAYLRSILVNICKSWERGNRYAVQLLPEMEIAAPPQEVAGLLGALDGLPARQRAALVLRYYEDQTDTQIATSLGCRPATVRSLISRGLKQLRRKVQR